MRHRNVIMLCVLAVVCTPASVLQAQEEPPPSALEQVEYLEKSERELTADGTASDWDVANGWLDAAEARLAAGKPWADQLFINAGLAFRDGLWRLEALAVFTRLERIASTEYVRRYAVWMQGRIQYSRGSYEQAIEHFDRYRRMVATAEDGSRTPEEVASSQGATFYIASALSRSGNNAAAIETRAALLVDPGAAALSDVLFSRLCVENARDAFAIGNVAEGKAWFELLFTERPGVGLDDGAGVSWRNERVRAGRSLGEINDRDAVDAYRRIWTDPALREVPEIMHTAHQLEVVLYQRGERDAHLAFCEEAWQHVLQHMDLWREKLRLDRLNGVLAPTRALAASYVNSLHSAALAGRRRWEDVLAVGPEVLARLPGSESRAAVGALVNEALAKLD